MMRCIIMVLFLITAQAAQAQSVTEKIRELNLEKCEGPAASWYSRGFKDRSAGISSLLGKSAEYFQQNFGVQESWVLAVLDSTDWAGVTGIPYGVPFVSGPPFIVCIPADSRHDLAKIISAAVAGKQLENKYSLTIEEIVNRFTALIGFHELGHIYAREYGIVFTNKWTFEFTATYFAYAYLEENFPRENELWQEVSVLLLKTLNPAHTSLQDFENLCVQVGVENYAWYQVVFLMQAAEVYRAEGRGFLRELKNNVFRDESGSFLVKEWEAIHPGFLQWAAEFGLLP
ncbi:MAG: hypothetical protein WAN36_10590 [Calditrichia bacterium]